MRPAHPANQLFVLGSDAAQAPASNRHPSCDVAEPAHLHGKHERTAEPQPREIAALRIGLI